MALTEWNFTPGVSREGIVATQTVTAVTGGASTLGGTYSIRILVDDAVALSESDVLRSIDVMKQRIKADTWPPSLVINSG